MTVGITSPRQALARKSPPTTTGRLAIPAAAMATSSTVIAAKPVSASRTTRIAPNRCPSPAAACEAAKNPMALIAKASENWVGDRPKALA